MFKNKSTIQKCWMALVSQAERKWREIGGGGKRGRNREEEGERTGRWDDCPGSVHPN